MPVTFAVAADEWLKLKKPTWAPKSYEIEARSVALLKPAFGSLLMIDITPEDIADYQRGRRKAGASAKSVNLEVGTLRAVLIRHRLWSDLQADVKMLPTTEEIGKALSADEEKRLIEACRVSRSRALLPIVTLAIHTGMRKDEIPSLRWNQIDFLDKTVTVGRTKTKAGSGRVIPLNQVALLTLQTWAANFPDRKAEHFVFPREHYGFFGPDAKPHAKTTDPAMRLGDVKTSWKTARRDANVQTRFHDLRHTAATRLLERGASLAVVASIMGWSPSTTAKMVKRYGHIGNDARRAALDTLTRAPEHRAVTEDEIMGQNTGSGQNA